MDVMPNQENRNDLFMDCKNPMESLKLKYNENDHMIKCIHCQIPKTIQFKTVIIVNIDEQFLNMCMDNVDVTQECCLTVEQMKGVVDERTERGEKMEERAKKKYMNRENGEHL